MSVNFFEHQEHARKSTKILVVFFFLAVVSILLITNIFLALVFQWADLEAFLSFFQSGNYQAEPLFAFSSSLLAIIFLVVFFRWNRLKKGGYVIAEMLGGKRVDLNNQDVKYQQLINIVDEMALAANMLAPPVYVLPEKTINAFAAGYTSCDAVVGVTEGCLEHLSRDELQGVIAHEFSHILNGDMRLNIRMMAFLAGINFIGKSGVYLLFGSARRRYYLNQRASRDDARARMFIMFIGLGLVIIGYVGTFFTNIIKLAIGRQREYLADASSVQFTRNPQAISGALKKIASLRGGSSIKSDSAEECSHLFFSRAVSRWLLLFSTHPPIEKRIKRVEPNWDGTYPKLSPKKKEDIETEEKKSSKNPFFQDKSNRALAALPMALLRSARSPDYADAVILALLMNDSEFFDQQVKVIDDHGSFLLKGNFNQVKDQFGELSEREKLVMALVCIKQLKSYGVPRFEIFEKCLFKIIDVDQKLNLLEWAIANIVKQVVSPHVRNLRVNQKHGAKKIGKIKREVLGLLCVVVSKSYSDESEQLKAWNHAIDALKFADEKRPEMNLEKIQADLPKLMNACPKVKEVLWKSILSTFPPSDGRNEKHEVLIIALSVLLDIPYIE